VEDDVKLERRERVMLAQQAIAIQRAESMVGAEVEVLLEGEHEETELLWRGRMATQAPEIDAQVLVNDASGAAFGDFVTVRITETAGYDLVGEVVRPST
jgi:ribosomal protein S12 methylthiotransferase